MTHSEGVPLTRELLEALRVTAADVALGHDGILSVHARRLADACAAALASDAGEVREHLYDYSRHIYHLGAEETAAAAITAVNEARDSGYKVIVEVSGFGALEFYAIPERGTAASTRSCNFVPAPAPDAALVQKCGACGHDRVAHRGRTGQCIGIVAPDSLPCYCREFVADESLAQAVRESRESIMREPSIIPPAESSDAPAPAPAPGDASGETAADFESALDAYRDELMSNTRVGASGGLRALEPDRTELRRLYRAATGEVVGTGYIATSTDGGIDFYAQSWAFTGDKLDPIRGLNVLVVRRDKEGA